MPPKTRSNADNADDPSDSNVEDEALQHGASLVTEPTIVSADLLLAALDRNNTAQQEVARQHINEQLQLQREQWQESMNTLREQSRQQAERAEAQLLELRRQATEQAEAHRRSTEAQQAIQAELQRQMASVTQTQADAIQQQTAQTQNMFDTWNAQQVHQQQQQQLHEANQQQQQQLHENNTAFMMQQHTNQLQQQQNLANQQMQQSNITVAQAAAAAANPVAAAPKVKPPSRPPPDAPTNLTSIPKLDATESDPTTLALNWRSTQKATQMITRAYGQQLARYYKSYAESFPVGTHADDRFPDNNARAEFCTLLVDTIQQVSQAMFSTNDTGAARVLTPVDMSTVPNHENQSFLEEAHNDTVAMLDDFLYTTLILKIEPQATKLRLQTYETKEHSRTCYAYSSYNSECSSHSRRSYPC